jgi:hypothetical protein
MNGVSVLGWNRGLPATAVVRLSGNRPLAARQSGNATGDEALLAAITHPPRIGDARPLAALLPQVLARYGLTEPAKNGSEATASFAGDPFGQLDIRA